MWSSISRLLRHLETVLGVGLLIIATSVLFLNVVLRYFFGNGLTWGEEVISFSMVWVTFLGAALAARKKSHVAMTIIMDSIKAGSAKKYLSILLVAISILFCLIITYLGMKQVLFLMRFEQLSPALRLPMYIPYLAVPVGFGLMLIRFIEEFFETLKFDRSSTN